MTKQNDTEGLIGTPIGNYVIKQKLGEGGMGTVYLAVHPFLGTQVAVKVLARHVSARPEGLARFRNEALIVARIQHESIVKISDFGELPDQTPYFVMEYMEGRELADLLRARGPLPVEQVLALLEPICEALQAAHDQGVVHRDLKPENIFVLSLDPPRVKLLDFGISKLLEREESMGLTASGVILGTPYYMSPEQGLGKSERIGPWSDLYSLGVILYQMLCGTTPFQESSVALMIAAHVKDPPPLLSRRAPHLPPGVVQVIHQCLAKEPEARPGSAREVAASFRAGLSGQVPSRNVGAQGSDRSAGLDDKARHGGASARDLPSAPVLAAAGDPLDTTTIASWTGQVAMAPDPPSRRLRLGLAAPLFLGLVGLGALGIVLLTHEPKGASPSPTPPASTIRTASDPMPGPASSPDARPTDLRAWPVRAAPDQGGSHLAPAMSDAQSRPRATPPGRHGPGLDKLVPPRGKKPRSGKPGAPSPSPREATDEEPVFDSL